jgi:amino acid transporter
MRRGDLGLLDLVLFNVVAVLGVQWIAVSAHVGPVSILLHLTAALFFLVPCANIVAALSRRFPGEGGFYVWTRAAFGERHAFLCGWCWWLSVLLYLPGLLLAGAGMAGGTGVAFASESRIMVPFTLFVLWTVAGVNIVGFRAAKWIGNVGGALMYGAGAIVFAASSLVALREGPAPQLAAAPDSLTLDRLSLWAQIAFAYTGLELGSLLGREVRDPARTFPRAVWLGSLATTAAYLLGTVSLLLVLPPDRIQPMTGLVDAATYAGSRLGAPWLGPLTGAMLFAGITGKFSAWASGSARLPALIGLDGAFPSSFAALHPRWNTPYVALIVQSTICSAFLVIAHAGETVRAGWQVITDMAVITGLLPFLYIFLTAWRFGHRWSAASGLAVTTVAVALALVPPPESSSVLLFESKVVGGCVLLMTIGFAIRARRRSRPYLANLNAGD